MDADDEVDFSRRYWPLRRETATDIIYLISDDIKSGHYGRNQDFTPTPRTRMSLCFYATGISQTVFGILDVSRAIARC